MRTLSRTRLFLAHLYSFPIIFLLSLAKIGRSKFFTVGLELERSLRSIIWPGSPHTFAGFSLHKALVNLALVHFHLLTIFQSAARGWCSDDANIDEGELDEMQTGVSRTDVWLVHQDGFEYFEFAIKTAIETTTL